MKKLILFFVAVLFAANVSAERGSMVVNGSISFGSQNEANSFPSSNSFTIRPNFQYFLTDRFSLGVDAGFNTSKTGNLDRRNVINVGVFGRYYMLRTDRFGVFGQANIGATLPNEAAGSWRQFDIIIAPGIQYFINSRWSVETRLSPLISLSSSHFFDDRDTSRSFFTGVSSSMSWFSINFHF